MSGLLWLLWSETPWPRVQCSAPLLIQQPFLTAGYRDSPVILTPAWLVLQAWHKSFERELLSLISSEKKWKKKKITHTYKCPSVNSDMLCPSQGDLRLCVHIKRNEGRVPLGASVHGWSRDAVRLSREGSGHLCVLPLWWDSMWRG